MIGFTGSVGVSDKYSECSRQLPSSALRSAHTKLMGMIASMSAALDAANVTYMMIDGTLLGSFRHHGFIPWDDDAECAFSYF